jgi:hypothetical protein
MMGFKFLVVVVLLYCILVIGSCIRSCNEKINSRDRVLLKHCSQVCKDFGSTTRRCKIGVVECSDGKVHNFLSSWYEP